MSDFCSQKKYLQDKTHSYVPLSAPLKNGPKIKTLKDLIKGLHEQFDPVEVDIDMVNHIMLSYQSNPEEWKQYYHEDPEKYTRNLVDEGNGKFNLILLVWNKGQGSLVHDHSGSHCFMKILQGNLVETRYEWPENSEKSVKTKGTCSKPIDIGIRDKCCSSGNEELKEISVQTLKLNDVGYMKDDLGLHKVENQSTDEVAVSLHLYCPPFDTCAAFRNGEKLICPVTFYSRFGKKE